MASTQETEMIREPAEDIRPIEDEVILRAEQIAKVYPGTTALDGVGFDVYRGKVNVLVGENGAGK